MKLYLVRHGETDLNKAHIMQGRSLNPDLNENGVNSAKALRIELNNIVLDACFTSPLLRSCSTARILTDNKIEIKPDDRIIERYLGKLEGKDRKEYNVSKYWDINENSNDYDVEPIKNVLSRCEDFLKYLKDHYNDDANILIVSHNAIIKALINIVENKNYKQELELYSVPNCYYKCIEYK